MQEALKHENTFLIGNIALALSHIEDHSALIALVRALEVTGSRIDSYNDDSSRKSDYFFITSKIAKRLGEADESILPHLGKLLTPNDRWVRAYAFKAFSQVAHNHPKCNELTEFLPILEKAVHEQPEVYLSVGYMDSCSVPKFARKIIQARANASAQIDNDQKQRSSKVTSDIATQIKDKGSMAKKSSHARPKPQNLI